MEYSFKTKPFKYQFDEFMKSRDFDSYGIFWEQGVGKSKITIDQICWAYLQGKINAVCVVAPPGVHNNWIEEEILNHFPDEVIGKTNAYSYKTNQTKRQSKILEHLLTHTGLSVIALTYDQFITENARKFLRPFFINRKVFFVLDESQSIKNPESERTPIILKASRLTTMRRVLSGTPIAQGPFDMYAQIDVLDPNFWASHGLPDYQTFKLFFGIFKKIKVDMTRNGKTFKVQREITVAYKNLNVLNTWIREISTRLTKEEALPFLPPKRYHSKKFSLTDNQKRLYVDLRDEFCTFLSNNNIDSSATGRPDCPECCGSGEINTDGFIYRCGCIQDVEVDPSKIVVAEAAITRMLRLQQITCGYVPTIDPDVPLHVIEGGNPRLDTLLELAKSDTRRTICWARFTEDINLIMSGLKSIGVRVGRYDGKTSDDERADTKYRFQGIRPIFEQGLVVGREVIPDIGRIDWIAANPAAAATGLTLTAGKRAIYYSNNFKLTDRLQSEDRIHRIGQDEEVDYIDLIADGTIDERIVEALRNKFDIASQINGDKLKQWI